MSFAEIVEELPKLTPQQRHEIAERALALDGGWQDADAPLTDAEKAILEERFRDLDANPGASIPWEEAKAHLLTPKKQ